MIVMSSNDNSIVSLIVQISNDVMGFSFGSQFVYSPFKWKHLEISCFVTLRFQFYFLELLFDIGCSHAFAQAAGTPALHGVGRQNADVLFYFTFINLRASCESQID